MHLRKPNVCPYQSDVQEANISNPLLTCLQAQRKGESSTIKPEEREFVVDSRASMHKVSKKDLHSSELETMRMSRNPTTVMTANGEVQTRDEAMVCQRIGLIRDSDSS